MWTIRKLFNSTNPIASKKNNPEALPLGLAYKRFYSCTAFDYLTGKVNRFQSKRSLPSDKFRKNDKAFTVMVSDQTSKSISRGGDSVRHATVKLLAVFYVFHLEYPQPLRDLYLYLQQFI